MSTDYEPTKEQVEALAKELHDAGRPVYNDTLPLSSMADGWCAMMRAEARFVLRRQHERERGLTRNLRRISECVSIEWARHIATATLAAHAALDAPKVPTPCGCPCCGAPTVFVRGRHPGTDKREVCPTCLLEKVEDMAANATRPVAYKAAVEREERGA